MIYITDAFFRLDEICKVFDKMCVDYTRVNWSHCVCDRFILLLEKKVAVVLVTLPLFFMSICSGLHVQYSFLRYEVSNKVCTVCFRLGIPDTASGKHVLSSLGHIPMLPFGLIVFFASD